MIFRTLLIFQITLIFLKIDNLIVWKWKHIILPYWLLFSVFVAINFALILMFISKICQKIHEKTNNYESKKKNIKFYFNFKFLEYFGC